MPARLAVRTTRSPSARRRPASSARLPRQNSGPGSPRRRPAAARCASTRRPTYSLTGTVLSLRRPNSDEPWRIAWRMPVDGQQFRTVRRRGRARPRPSTSGVTGSPTRRPRCWGGVGDAVRLRAVAPEHARELADLPGATPTSHSRSTPGPRRSSWPPAGSSPEAIWKQYTRESDRSRTTKGVRPEAAVNGARRTIAKPRATQLRLRADLADLDAVDHGQDSRASDALLVVRAAGLEPATFGSGGQIRRDGSEHSGAQNRVTTRFSLRPRADAPWSRSRVPVASPLRLALIPLSGRRRPHDE